MALLAGALLAQAQTPARFGAQSPPSSGDTLTVKSDQGERARWKFLQRGGAARRSRRKGFEQGADHPIQRSGRGRPRAGQTRSQRDRPTAQALRVVAIKQYDLALKQQKEREDWQRRGVGGLVKSVDAAAGVIVLTSGAGADGEDDHRQHHQGNDPEALRARLSAV